MKRAAALILAVLMIIQILPVQADTYSDWYQVDTQDPAVYHTVRFVVDGEEISAVSVADGSSLTELPVGPEKSGYRFIGWFALDLAVTLDTVITADMTVEAAYEKEDDSLITGPVFVGMGLYANVTVSGTYHKDRQPSVERTDRLGDEAVLEAWTVKGIKNKSSLAIEAVITSQPEGGTLSAFTVANGKIGEKVASGLSIGDRVAFALSMKGPEGIALVLEKISGDGNDPNGLADGVLYANKNFYLSGKLPKDGQIDVQPVRMSIDGEEVLAACDIKIYTNGNQKSRGKTWQPADKKVTVHWYNAAFENRDLNIYHYADGAAVPDLVASVTAQDGWVEFEADGFSVYVVTETTYLRTYRFFTFDEYGDYVEYAFYSDNGLVTFTQTIKNGENLIAPQNPTNPQDPGATFAGWFEDVREAGATEPVLAETAYDLNNIPAITQTEEVHLYAKFTEYAYIIFHDQYDAETETFPVAYTHRAELTEGSAEVDISAYGVTYHGGGNAMVFTGWSEVPITTPGSVNNDLGEAVIKLDDTITVTGNKELYPIFTPVYWLSFYSGPTGSGATYYPDTYYHNGAGPADLIDHIPSRAAGSSGAYRFIGWYADASLGAGNETSTEPPAVKIADAEGGLVAGASATGISVDPAGQSITLTADVMLYAAWEITDTAGYSVVIWKQKASDTAGLADENKSYDFEEKFVLSGVVGDIVSVETVYQSLTELESYNTAHPGAQISSPDENPYHGFEYSRSDTSAEVRSDGGTVLNVYYDRSDFTEPSGSYTLVFVDSVTAEGETSSSLPITAADIPYGTDLAANVPSDIKSGRNGYTFLGWYADRDCTIRVFFDQASYDAFSGVKALYSAMPDHDLTVYAGWEEEWYLVKLDPNYGAMYAYNGSELEGTGSTWFWSTYGSQIQEYTTVTRDYVESSSGTYYYVDHNRAFYGYPDVWVDEESTQQERKTYYTQDPGEATEFTTFAYEPGIYRYAGWYEVNEDGTETLYDFNGIIDRNITLKLHWTKVGAFYLVYDPGAGTLDANEDQETLYVELDGDTYADNADVQITRIATPPDGYEFVGWTIRGDDSGKVYYPGSSFTLLTKYAATVQGKKTVYLDAVYSRVATASIVYDANGGTITESELDYGSPFDPAAPTPVRTCDKDAGTATISNLVNNSRIYLSDGSGFSKTDAVFVGWSNKSVYDPDDEEAVLYLPGVQTEETYHVDIAEPFVLYAVWQVDVRYHLNQTEADFGVGWGSEFTLNAAGDTYIQSVYIGTAAGRPAATPVYTGQDDLTFRWWATKDDGGNYTMYDFTQPVTAALDLYAYWAAPMSVTVHALDATEEVLADRDNTWRTQETMFVEAVSIELDETTASGYVLVPSESDYAFAFAAVFNRTGDPQGITDSDAVASLRYDSSDGKIHAVYKNGNDAALADDDEIFFIYYRQKKLSIGYDTMADDGTLTPAAVASDAPAETEKLGQYDMAGSVAAPLAWLGDDTYTCYAFAVGSASAGSAEDLSLITGTSDTDSERPALLIENTWRGFRYSTDGRDTWTVCGYTPALYVVYFAQQATVVTFGEKTVGLAADMGTQFTFNYRIETVDLTDGSVTAVVYDTEASGNSPVLLRNGEAYSTILFTDAASTQRVTVTQTQAEGFTTTVSDGTSASLANPYSFTADGTGTPREVIFTNTRDIAAMVEVHVALVDVAGGTITLRDDLRRPECSFVLPLDSQSDLETILSPEELFTGDTDEYAFGAVLYGTDDNGIVTVDGMGAASVACELADPEDERVYDVYLKDSDGSLLTDLGIYTLYYLYYPMPVIRYMEERDAGALTPVQGSADGTSVSDTITYDGAVLTLNGHTVEQDQKLKVPQSGLIISQSVGSECFNMPPLLDKETNRLYLVYSRIGVGAPGQSNISDISSSTDLTLYLRIRENRLEWSFDGNTWTAFNETPVIYAIYQERGYTLEITKTVSIDTGFREPFTLTISSTAINRTGYSVEGTGYSTVAAEQANGSDPGTITVEVEDGSDIKIFGLGSGTYTVSETGNGNHILTAAQRYYDEGNPVTEDLDVTDNSTVSIELDREKTLDLTNTPKVICKVGTRYFYTIQSAVQWIEDNSATFSGTIEMLVDYMMPSSDAVDIPYYLDITLTTAPEYGSGSATITRSGSFSSGPMFTNSGTLSLQGIVLDGNGGIVTSSSAMIDNEGKLTIDSGTVLKNAVNSGNGGAVNSWNGSVIVSGGTISGNSAQNGGAVYAAGGSVIVDSGTVSGNSAQSGGAVYYTGNGSVEISGGSLNDNSADNGGAVYLEKGSLTVSDGIMASNTAALNGGAVYVVNGAIEVTGGTIGGPGAGNNAQSGGAVYLESGSVTVSGSAEISNNTASENGGGICTDTGTVTISGGTLAYNTSAVNGGGVYTASGAITVSGSSTVISGNSAASGGGLYSDFGPISIANATVRDNSATDGNGGGVYADAGTVSLNRARFTGNSAPAGSGGGVYGGSGAITLTNCTFGGASGSGNSAVNGGAVYTNTGSVTFTATNVRYNTATEGGAVGVGSGIARLYFSGNTVVRDNTMSGSPSNVYLDQDSDAVINATGLNGSAFIGIYVAGETTEELFLNRGVPGAQFGTYTSANNVAKFSNDRLSGLSVGTVTTSKKLIWSRPFTVEVRYLASYAGGFPPEAAGTPKYTVDNYDPPAGGGAISEIAEDLRSTNSNVGSTTAAFGCAFVEDASDYSEYLTSVVWDSESSSWQFVKRDGTLVSGAAKLIVYFSEPSYISIENNTQYPLTVSDLTVLGKSAINSDEAAGYGYVFAKDGAIQDELQPITAADLVLQPGKNIKLLFPGGKDSAWKLSGSFDGASESISYTLNGAADTLASDAASDFVLNGKTLNTNGGTYEIVFGSSAAICKIVTTAIPGVLESEIAGQTTPDENNRVEYTFSTLNQAVSFAKKYSLTNATVEMLVDYLIPDSDVVSLPANYNFTFTTAVSGVYKYSEDGSARATISRDPGNLKSFITIPDGKVSTTLTVENLIFDGKSFSGSIDGGVIKTKNANVSIDRVAFNNCIANNGGGIYVEYDDKNVTSLQNRLTVANSAFTNCVSKSTASRQGGGAVWTNVKTVEISGSSFTNCTAVDQGGAVFHRVDGNQESYTTLTNCDFTGCSANAAGSMETDAKRVTLTGCNFKNSIAKQRNGGGVNIYALNNANPGSDCWVTVTGCTFEDCYALNQNGGGFRSTAVYTTVEDCVFKNASGQNGGAISISSTNAKTAVINGCDIDGGVAVLGGGIYCMAVSLTVGAGNGKDTTIRNCTAEKDGGGIYQGKDANGSSLTVSDTTITNCVSNTAAGGGIYSMAQKVETDDLTISSCTAKTQGGGIYLYPKSSAAPKSAALTDTVIQNCNASGNGGGICYDVGSTFNVGNTLIMDGTGSVSGNTSGGMGGGIYTNAAIVSLTGTSVLDNTASGNGGGVCQNVNNASSRLTVDSCTIAGNTSGGKGGGTYTLGQMTIRNDTTVSGNHLSTDTVTDAAGVYLQNGRTLTVGTVGAAADSSSVTGNLTLSGNPSDLRLSQQSGSLTSNNSVNSVDVLCHLSGEFRVIDAFSKGTQFGVTEVSTADSPVYTIGFSDLNHVFIADDDSLYGIIDRSDASLRRIIWAGEPVCKITDDRGRLLYLDTSHEYPAVFDKLDTGDENSTAATTAFSLLRNETPPLYYADGTLYTGSTYQVKMLVENYTANNRINTPNKAGRTVIFTTAGSADSQYPYRGRSGTRSTVTRGTGVGNHSFITAKSNLTLTNIVLDGGSEIGLTAGTRTRIINASTNGATITLGRNAALQNASTTGDGGAVYLENASLVIEGGAIRNCSAVNGGAVYKTGADGVVTFRGGSITRCTATGNGGGICIFKGPAVNSGDSFTMTGGSITRCTAKNGGGVWISDKCRMSMSGGSISANSASNAGGGIMLGGSSARLNFSGAAFVYGNTCETSVAPSKASNVHMNQSFSVGDNNPGTIIHTTGLIRGATIGVYVPDAQYEAHGDVADPFATYEGMPAGLNYFINDRNGLKGGLMEGQAVGTDMKVYWRQIYTLEIDLEVLSRAPADKEKDFRFTVTLSGTVGGVQWNEVNDTYGDLQFRSGVATFMLNGSTNTSTMADLLPLGYGYTVTMDPTDAAGYAVYPDTTQSGEMNDPAQFLYTVNFRVVRDVICKITDETYGLLYYKRGEAYVEAVYDALVSAFNRVNMGELYYKVGDSYVAYNANDHRIEMLVPSYDMTEAAALTAGKTVMLTTADPDADDGFPYAGGSSTAVIRRAYSGESMITVNGDLTLGDITLDGNGSDYPVSCNGGIAAVNHGGVLTAGTGAALRNSVTSGSGAGVYLDEGSTMKLAGDPKFSGNTVPMSDTEAKNGDENVYASGTARQDIYIAGYSGVNATSLHVTGDLTGASGSIWVWAAEGPHYKQSKQFAVMTGGTHAGLNVFRNARTDADTENPLTTDPRYLYGIRLGNDGYVYWSGGADLTVIKTVTGDMGDRTRAFEFTITGLSEGQSYRYIKYTSADGAVWTEVTDGGGTLTSSENTFTLKHHEKAEIKSLPLNTPLTVTENDIGYYTVTWQIGSDTATSASKTVTLTEDSELTVTNYLPAVAPTGYSVTITPYLFLLLAGALLLLVSRGRRRPGKGGGAYE